MDAVPVRVRTYTSLVAAAAGILFVAAMVADPGALGRAPLVLTSLLLIAGVGAQRFPIHLSDKTKVYVDAAIFTAAALVLPPPVAMLVAALAVGVDELILRASWSQAWFNIAQTALYVGAGALTYEWLDAASLPVAPGLQRTLAILAAAAVMHLLNTALVAGVVARQLNRSTVRTWRESFALDLPQHLVLVAIGVLLALVVRDYPWLAPLFAAPFGFVYLSLRRGLQLRQATWSTLLAAADLVELLHQSPPGHSRRVALRARQLAERLGLGPNVVEDVETAARLHHLGDLEQGNWARDAGSAAAERPSGMSPPLAAFPTYARSAVAIRHLRERWDGTGFPEGLAGEAIPLPSRVIAAADAFDRLVYDPAGRCRSDVECALAVLRAGVNREWDPRVVEELVVVARGAPAADADSGLAAVGAPAVSG